MSPNQVLNFNKQNFLDCFFEKQSATKFPKKNNENRIDVFNIWRMVDFFHVLDLTGFLAINMCLRIPQKFQGDKKLIAATCLWIAIKYEEERPLEIDDMMKVLQNFNKSDILEMERKILFEIDYRIETTNPLSFLMIFSEIMECSKEVYFLAKYICILSSFSENFIPSEVAASSLYIARLVVDKNNDWEEGIQNFSKLYKDEMLSCAKELYAIHSIFSPKFIQSFKRYTKPKYMEVALLKI